MSKIQIAVADDLVKPVVEPDSPDPQPAAMPTQAQMMGELIVRLFHARTWTHVAHLMTRSFATHTALQEFYEKVVDLADELAEAYQGQYGVLDTYTSVIEAEDRPLILLVLLSNWITVNRSRVCTSEDTHLQNIIDEIVVLIRTTQYKLNVLS